MLRMKTNPICRIDKTTRELLRKRQGQILIKEGKRASFNDIIKEALKAVNTEDAHA